MTSSHATTSPRNSLPAARKTNPTPAALRGPQPPSISCASSEPWWARLVRAEMRENAVTGTELARALGCNKSTITKYLSGEIPLMPAVWPQMMRAVRLTASYRVAGGEKRLGKDLPSYVEACLSSDETKGFDPRLNIDRLTLLAEPRDRDTYFGSIRPHLTGAFSSGKLYKTRVHLKKLGVVVSCRPTDEDDAATRRFIRIEFQPKALQSPAVVRKVFKRFIHPFVEPGNIWLSRIDLCVDYPVGIEAFHHAVFFGRRTWRSFIGRGGNETLYYGSKDSELFCRVYDKNLERVRSGKARIHLFLTRVEVEHRPKKRPRLRSLARLPDLFEPFGVMSVPEISSLPFPYSHVAMLIETYGREFVHRITPSRQFKHYERLLEGRRDVGRFAGPSAVFALQFSALAKCLVRNAGLRKTNPKVTK